MADSVRHPRRARGVKRARERERERERKGGGGEGGRTEVVFRGSATRRVASLKRRVRFNSDSDVSVETAGRLPRQQSVAFPLPSPLLPSPYPASPPARGVCGKKRGSGGSEGGGRGGEGRITRASR